MMARRPSAPRPSTPRPGTSRPTTGARRAASPAPSALSAPSASSPSPAPRPRPSTRSRVVGRPRPESTPAASAEKAPDSGGRVVQAAERFRALVAGQPWRRRRRALIIGTTITALVLVAALLTAIFLPALQVREVTVSGTGYVQEEAIRDAAAPHLGGSVLLLPTASLTEAVGEVPGVASVEVDRHWPDGARITITEAVPVAMLTRTDGTTAVLDATGEELPAAAAEGETLVPLTVDGGSADPEGATAAMSEVLAEIPSPLRGAVQEVTASSTSDVTLVIGLEGGGTKTVVWGDAQDAELKAEAVHALLGQPGGVIDVSSPVAPVTR